MNMINHKINHLSKLFYVTNQIKAGDDLPLTMIMVRENSQVVIIYPDSEI